ncbi:T9SS type A sorting domain-containing protein [Flavobacterium sp.]|uniref:T9SS type A sorting domain-containing protein n=1 Tax=Flavobacterium sp. TaxID=239 RepID=UPI003C32DA59
MKKRLLKKISLFVALIGLSGAQMTAQTTIINEDFGAAAYSGASDAANLNTAGPNIWISGHNANPTQFGINAANSNVYSTSNYNWAVHNTPIKGVSGNVITITTEIGFDGTAIINDKAFDLVGLVPFNDLATIKSTIASTRDGVIVNTASPNLVISSTGGTGAFASNPSIVQAASLLANYEIIIEYTIGTTAANTVKKARIRNTTSGVVSTVGVSTGIGEAVYTALTGATGAYFVNWTLGFYDGLGINRIRTSKLTVVKNPTTSLSTTDFNRASIAANVSPNPVSSVLNISSDLVTKKYRIINLAGATVIETVATGSVDVSGLANGVYLLVTDAGIAKFIKE